MQGAADRQGTNLLQKRSAECKQPTGCTPGCTSFRAAAHNLLRPPPAAGACCWAPCCAPAPAELACCCSGRCRCWWPDPVELPACAPCAVWAPEPGALLLAVPVWSLAAAELGSVLASGLAACISGMDDWMTAQCGFAPGVGQTDSCRGIVAAGKPSHLGQPRPGILLAKAIILSWPNTMKPMT